MVEDEGDDAVGGCDPEVGINASTGSATNSAIDLVAEALARGLPFGATLDFAFLLAFGNGTDSVATAMVNLVVL